MKPENTLNVNIAGLEVMCCYIVSVTQHTTQLSRGISEMSCHVTFLLFAFVLGGSKKSCWTQQRKEGKQSVIHSGLADAWVTGAWGVMPCWRPPPRCVGRNERHFRNSQALVGFLRSRVLQLWRDRGPICLSPKVKQRYCPWWVRLRRSALCRTSLQFNKYNGEINSAVCSPNNNTNVSMER